MKHEPVLLQESIDALQVRPDGVYVDATFGGGGHSAQILNKLGPEGSLVAFDQDQHASNRLIKDERLIFVNENFRHLKRFLRFHKIEAVDGILADLGMSSFQLDSTERGFATRFDADLDMRMNLNAETTAADILNNYSADDLQLVFQEYGELRNSKSLANKIVEERKVSEFTTTKDFISRISSLIKGNENRYLAQVFQALRIEVNKEMDALKEFLMQGAEVLKENGRFAVISFHSLEDRVVKRYFKTGSFDGKIKKDVFGNFETPLNMITKKPTEASEAEKQKNPRSRSAKLRVAIK